MPTPPVFVLDHNFPETAVWQIPMPEMVIRPLRVIHPDLVRNTEDWELLRDLRLRGGVDGLITLDAGMVNLEKEMVVLHQSRLSLVVFEGVENDPLVAAGLLLVHAPTIARQTSPRRAQLWVLRRPATRPPENPQQRINTIAARLHVTPEELYARNRLPSNLFLRRS